VAEVSPGTNFGSHRVHGCTLKKSVKIHGICENLPGRVTERKRFALGACLYKQLLQSKSARPNVPFSTGGRRK